VAQDDLTWLVAAFNRRHSYILLLTFLLIQTIERDNSNPHVWEQCAAGRCRQSQQLEAEWE